MVFSRTFCLVGCDDCSRTLGGQLAPLSLELCFGDIQVSGGLLDGQTIRKRIDLEKEAPLSDAHILNDGEFNDTATDSGGDVHNIRINRSVTRCRMGLSFAQRINCQRDSQRDNGD
jgi:hypothetical protein